MHLHHSICAGMLVTVVVVCTFNLNMSDADPSRDIIVVPWGTFLYWFGKISCFIYQQ